MFTLPTVTLELLMTWLLRLAMKANTAPGPAIARSLRRTRSEWN